MDYRVSLLTLAAAIAPGLAFAHGPTRQKVTETIVIDAPADKVWAAMGNFQDMSWHPAVQKTEGTGGNTPDSATRLLTLGPGATIEEALIKFEPVGKSYSYRITNVDVKVLPVTNYSSTITVKPDGAKSIVEWRGAFYRGFPNNDPPAELNDEAAVKAVTGVYRLGLEALKKKVEAGS